MVRFVLAVLALLLVTVALGQQQRSTKKSSVAASKGTDDLVDPRVAKLRTDCRNVKGTFISRPFVDCERATGSVGSFPIGDITRATCCYQRSAKEVRDHQLAVSMCLASLGGAYIYGQECPVDSNPASGVPVINIKGATYTCCKTVMSSMDKSFLMRTPKKVYEEISSFAKSCEPFAALRVNECNSAFEKEISSKTINKQDWKCCLSHDNTSGAPDLYRTR